MFKTLITVASLFFTTINASAFQVACPEHYASGQAPVITAPPLAVKTDRLCNEAYAVIYSGVTRGPLVSAEHLTREHLQEGRGLPRENTFRPDQRLPPWARAELSDFARSGYDRGHMAPSADAYSADSQDGTFLLSNMIPQDPDNNRHLHESIEAAVRHEASRRGDLYVITGPLFKGGKIKALKGRVVVPTGIFKCIYDQRRQEAGCYLENNAPGQDYSKISVSQAENLAGINLYPAMPQQVKDTLMNLPVPRPYSERNNQWSHTKTNRKHRRSAN